MTDLEPSPIDQKSISLLWAGPDTAGEIVQIQSDAEGKSWGEQAVRDLLANPAASSLLAKIRLQPDNPPVAVGYVMGQIAADQVEILSLGVLKPFQKFGIGRQLVEGLSRAAKQAEATAMFLEVAVDNDSAIALYNKLGFQQTGRRDGYYKSPEGTKVDAYTMSRSL